MGDDLTCTNPARIKEAVARKEINAVLIKPNQIGTVMEAIKAVQETRNLLELARKTLDARKMAQTKSFEKLTETSSREI